MARSTTIKDALKRWQEDHDGQNPIEAEDIQLQFRWPPIERMDGTLGTLVNCQKLSLSSNMIEKITGLNGMKNLRILALGRNYIKSFNGLEAVGDTLEELWISYNQIDKLKGVESLRKLKVLYMANNTVRDWAELARLQAIAGTLEDLVFAGNPLVENLDEAVYFREVTKRLPTLKKLDGIPMLTDDAE
ncbi:AGAP008526-PA-like protein [Anopheles sinensis]|uniref:Dynein axonemal light chain 1 n=1 Tax=Anopheles sinensis TaxID=74873 RepID=A0A084VBE2_ANOSI|nr:AGAP008526-PA-like protein [Anopheles sinensis]